MKVVLAGVLIVGALLLGELASAAGRPAAGSRGVPNLSPLLSEEPQSAGRVPDREDLALQWNLYWLYAVPPPIVEGPPTYIGRPSRPYSYYCLSAGAYYPDVSRCPEPWLAVVAHR